MYRREITERESASSREKQKERTSARQKREPRCFRAFSSSSQRKREREREKKFIARSHAVDFFSRVKNKNSIAGV